MFDVSLSWYNGAAQIIIYAAIIGAILWVLSKVEINEREGKK